MKFVEMIDEMASYVLETLREIGEFTIFAIVFAVIILTLPIWIVPYAIYKQFKRGK